MRLLGLLIGVVIVFSAHVAAADSRFERSLKMLAPSERLEQLCDYTAMVRIRKDQKQYRPDRAVANATADVKQTSHVLIAKGAAVRAALLAHDAEVEVRGPQGGRTLPLAELFAPPTADRRRETTLRPGEIITALLMPAAGSTGTPIVLTVNSTGDDLSGLAPS